MPVLLTMLVFEPTTICKLLLTETALPDGALLFYREKLIMVAVKLFFKLDGTTVNGMKTVSQYKIYKCYIDIGSKEQSRCTGSI
jgi:hypothetical protein